MTIENPLLARIAGQEVLVAPDRRDWFQSCLTSVLAMPDADKLLAPAMYGGQEDDYWPEADSWEARYKPYVVQAGILQVPVFGVLLNRLGYQIGRYATGYTYIERATERGMGDPAVQGIAYICDTPGGEVAGNFELVDKLYGFRGQKPMRAFSAESAYSAGYSIASASDRIVMTRTSGVGSIGVVTAHVSYQKAMEKAGIEVTFIYAGDHKVDGNPYEKLSDDAKARIQARIDQLYSIFTGTVARNRGMSDDDVRATQAKTYMADEAIEIGLADSVGVLDESLEAFRLDCEVGDENMTTPAPGNVTGRAPAAGNDEAVSTARAEGVTAGKAEGLKEGATAEKTRIVAIMGCANAAKRPAAALAAALDTDMSVEQANTFLGKLAEEKATAAVPETSTAEPQGNKQFASAMEQQGGAGVGAEGGKGGENAHQGKGENALLRDWSAASGYEKK